MKWKNFELLRFLPNLRSGRARLLPSRHLSRDCEAPRKSYPTSSGQARSGNLTLAFALLLLVFAFSLTGCSNLYTVTFTRGTFITVKGKPRYDKATDSYLFTDNYGRPCKVPAISIREIAPASSDGGPAVAPVRTIPAR
jgi:hypothetical protein